MAARRSKPLQPEVARTLGKLLGSPRIPPRSSRSQDTLKLDLTCKNPLADPAPQKPPKSKPNVGLV